MEILASYLAGAWHPGTGAATPLVNPTTEEPLAVVHPHGVALGAALAYGRERGGAALRAMTFAERGERLAALAKAMHGAREELIALAVANAGNTRGDAKFDLDGCSGTLAHYAELAKALGDRRVLADGDAVQLGRTARLSGQHAWVPRPGVAVFVNAFNFPAWGLGEKLACAFLAGMPVVCKPATATALVTYRVVKLWADAGLLPEGSLQLLCGSAGDLLDHLGPFDVLAFTGSSQTARTLRSHPQVIAGSVRTNLEADSLNAAVLAPDVDLGSETGQLFLADVARDLTQKSGQKCTAIRRVLVPPDRRADVVAALGERLARTVIGDPSRDDVRMGPLATAAQRRDIAAGIARLAEVTEAGYGGTGEVEPVGVPAGRGYFVGPVVRTTADAAACAVMHEHEVFGPVVTVAGYDGSAEQAAALVARGEGSLVTSCYSDDKEWLARFVPVAGAVSGRVYVGSEKMASLSPGPGTALPQLQHGGPGRAGDGAELGGLRGLTLYQQRVALQGDASILKSLL